MDLQQDALATKGADENGAEGDAAAGLALGHLCADPDCDGFLCQVNDRFWLVISCY
jgi:hypothetical protein